MKEWKEERGYKYRFFKEDVWTLVIAFLGVWCGSEYEIMYGSTKMWFSCTLFVLVSTIYFIAIWTKANTEGTER